ncbi:MBL fold metallo-hydrolase [Streptomyces sp. SBT349]|uniref:MBL fold metallo-hydrolase n=1 Tax=Streptomyces sp. SBT349 TaxID=1580539 RepID=UPI00066CAA63|nr:MBL fold metallo-hydrolase [Streptomyces sp. SBT349]
MDTRDRRDTRWEEVTPGVLRRRLPGWDETVGAVAGEDGVLLVDAGPTRAAAEEVAREVRDLLGLPVTRVVLTHAHFDHVLGAGAFPGAELYAAAGLSAHLADGGRAALAEDAVRHGGERGAAEADAAALPGEWREVRGGLTVSLGGARSVVLAALGPAHSPNDLVVLVPGGPSESPVPFVPSVPPVLFCGDLVEESGEPQAGPDAVPERWPAALGRLLALGGERARYVPGHGAVVDAAFVRAQRAALDRLANR